jgi:predicted DCC family thiol-disulfide oxidoreductase YuxK
MKGLAAKVWFDGGCSLCSREIRHYRKLKGSDRIEWIDLAEIPDEELPQGVSRTEALKIFHVLDDQGELQKAARGFVAIWKTLPSYQWLGWLAGQSWLLGWLDKVYVIFAEWRFKRRCGTGVCGISGDSSS